MKFGSIFYLSLTAITLGSGFAIKGRSETKLPKIVIKSITNSTNNDLVLIDRLHPRTKPIVLPKENTVEVNIKCTQKNINCMGSLKEILAKQAQYVFKQSHELSRKNNPNEVYFHICVQLGGVNDGSGIIIGADRSIIYKFLGAGKQGGCIMSSGSLKSNPNQLEFNILISPNKYLEDEGKFGLNFVFQYKEV